YRNSVASRNTLNLTSKRFHGALVESKARFDINWQRESLLNDGTYQPEDRVLTLAFVNKADYLYQPTKKWRFVWQAKLMNLRRTRQSLEVSLVDEWTFMPIFKASYQISPNTEIWFGGHGFPGLEHRFKDRAKPRESFTEQTLVSQVVSRSEYYGYNITTSLGMTKSKRTYDDVLRKEENKNIVSAYLRVYLSFSQ
ncbi:MAG: hypothetical protein HY709_08680, partial [Candidatus Latescibacteria bacterium]|nr:hypothetical protein [Candidatus Latescibacterota bacterium]